MQRKKLFISAKRLERKRGQRYKVLRTKHVITLICDPQKIPEYTSILGENIWEAVHALPEIEYYRIGNRINLGFGSNMTRVEKTLKFWERTGYPLGLKFLRTYPLRSGAVDHEPVSEVHHLEYNQDEDILVGCPLMENDTIGLPDKIHNPSGEVKYLHDKEDVHKDQDVTELLKESRADYMGVMKVVLDSIPGVMIKQLRASDPFAGVDEHLNVGLEPEMVEKITEMIMNLPDDKSQKYFYSSLDISSAHTSVKLTENASHLLNFITPSLKIYKFHRSAFGLRSISTYFNTILIHILKDLLELGRSHSDFI